MLDLKLFLDDLAEDSQRVVENSQPIDTFIDGYYVEADSLRVFIHESVVDFEHEPNLTTKSPQIPIWLYKYAKIFKQATAEEVIFLDTETTGLDRGASTYAFLTGVCFFQNGKWQLRQYFIESPEHETLLIKLIAELLANFKVLVSYNGKCYDIPLLDNRFKYHKSDYSIRDLDLLDLLHLSRRFWKTSLPGCKLQNIETLVLGFIRDDSNDLPGELIPKAYFDFLTTGDATEISHVFYHNAQDLFSLIKILEICWDLDFADFNYQTTLKIDVHSLAKLLFDIGEEAISLQLLQELAKHDLINEKSLLLLTQLLKKKREYKLATNYLSLLEAESPAVCVELAKLYEHQLKDLRKAFYYSRKAYLLLHEESEFNNNFIAEVELRITRLKRKIDAPN